MMNQVPTAEDSIRALRRARAVRLLAKLGAFVVLPTLIAASYLFFFASSAYESVALFSIQVADERVASPMDSLMGVAGIGTGSRDTLAARDYVLSREMLRVLDDETGLLDHYRSEKIDYFSRLDSGASFEEAFEYYLDRVEVSYDSNSAVLTLKAKAYSPEMAHRMASGLLEASEKMVNALSKKARDDQIAVAQEDVENAEKRLSESRLQLVQLQQEHGEFSPEQTAQAALSIRTQLETELAKARAEYATLASYMAPNSPQVIAAKQRVASLSAQAQGETRRLVNKKDDQGLNKSLVEFERVLVEKEFATHAYQSALGAFEIARANAVRKHRYLAIIAHPSKPDEAMYPRRVLLTFTTFVVSLVLFGILSLAFAALKEHARL